MELNQAVWLLLVTAIVLANIPFILSNRLFLFIKVPHKSIVVNLIEWFFYFILTGIFAYLLENKSMGHVAEQTWEFYTITLFMFIIFAFPGFIYRYNLKQFLKKNKT
jgi:DNA integrity scanning protein DisA with diadenylate cyclase activity